MTSCTHPPTALVENDLTQAGIPAIVTACSMCGARIDYRPLREKDVEARYPTGSHPRIKPPKRASAKVEIKTKKEKSVSSGVKARPIKLGPEDVCSIEGGYLLLCSSGVGQAHGCVNSKWGDRRRRREGRGRPGNCNGPCTCRCHKADHWTPGKRRK